jgi:hypothetical protein
MPPIDSAAREVRIRDGELAGLSPLAQQHGQLAVEVAPHVVDAVIVRLRQALFLTREDGDVLEHHHDEAPGKDRQLARRRLVELQNAVDRLQRGGVSARADVAEARPWS